VTSSQLIDPNDLVDAARYASHGYPHDIWALLRREAPVHWCEPEGFPPFWAVTRHADIKHVSTHPELFLNAPQSLLVRDTLEAQGVGVGLRTLVNMDPPEHRDYRALAAPFFRPPALRALEDRVREITRVLFDRTARMDGPFDFVSEIASWHPLKVICEILGAGAEDEPTVLSIANNVLGIEDPEYAMDMQKLLELIFGYYREVIKGRQANPTDDLYSALVNADIAGAPIGRPELRSYFIILTTAGHDTTRSALTGGVHALIEHPDQLDWLRNHPDACATAADEIVRWTSPVVHFCRTSVEHVELGGKHIRPGELLVLFHPSANRDEMVFDDPFAFRVDRYPNPHLGFGFGEHFCLGANLARMELRILLEELVPRLDEIELAGPPERTAAIIVNGFKHLPIRWKLS
jgi:cytochrome P450